MGQRYLVVPSALGTGQAAVAVARPAVEGLFVAPALLLGRAHRRHREGTPEGFGREGAERLTLDEHDVVAERLDVALVLHRLERQLDPGATQRVVERLRAQVGVPAVEHDVVDLVSAPLGGQARRNERLRLVPGGGDGER